MKTQPITATKTDYKAYYLYFYIIILLHYKKQYYKVFKYYIHNKQIQPTNIHYQKSLNFFIKTIAYQKYFISLHRKLCLTLFPFFENIDFRCFSKHSVQGFFV